MLDLFVPYKKKIVREQRRWIVTVWRARPTLHSISRKCVSAFGMFAVSRMVFFIAFFNLRRRNNAIYRQKTDQQHFARGRPTGCERIVTGRGLGSGVKPGYKIEAETVERSCRMTSPAMQTFRTARAASLRCTSSTQNPTPP